MHPAFPGRDLVRTPSIIKHFVAYVIIAVTLASSAFAWGDIQQVNGDDFRTLIKQGDKLVRRGDYFEAEKIFKRAIEINPTNSGAKL